MHVYYWAIALQSTGSLRMTLFTAVVLTTAMRSLVLPFDNLTGSEDIGWLGGAVAESIGSHLEAAGQEVVSVRAVQRELMERGIAPGEPLTRESLVDIAFDLEADRIIIGSYENDDLLRVRVEVLAGIDGSILAVIEDHEASDQLLPLLNRVSKNIFRIGANRPPNVLRTHALRRVGLRLDAVKSMSASWLEPDAQKRLEHLEKAFEIDPRYVEARIELAEALLWMDAQENARQVMELLNAVPSQEPFYPRAYFGVGIAYLAEGEAEAARDIFSHLSLRPTDGIPEKTRASVFNNLGVAHLRLDDIPAAIEAFRRSVELDPGNARGQFNLAFAYWRQGKGHKALETLTSVVEENPIDAEAHWLLAAASHSQALADQAEVARLIAITLNPTLVERDPATVTGLERPVVTWRSEKSSLKRPRFDPDLDFLGETSRLGQARAFVDAGNTPQAIRLLQQELYLEPGASDVRLELARLYRKSGESKLAEGELQVALWHETRPDLHLELAELYVEMGQLEAAAEQVTLALDLAPDNVEALSMKERISETIPP